ncbi:protein inscuteable homolog isoform X1 [Neoarius graeffei]|uniref:protein inscuteable homolog isoform X1 n=1 Tax=Neoarius graeffei TaxID=443677 RepID=UPI00298CFF32|nr:protein inscuteable homolog isoform X1 [Neoarius graeffei]XP_060784541.1 protein inscuteable homolog isoform X1 [Neoarius graeffei]
MMETPKTSRANSTPLTVPMRMHVIQVDSVQRWMEDLRHMTEVECMCVLQSKPLGVDEDTAGELIIPGVGVAGDHVTRDNLQTLLKRALVVSTELGKMFQRLEKGRWQRVHGTAVRANCHVRSLVHECSTHRTNDTHMQKYEATLLEKCMELTVITERCLHTDDEYFLKSMKEAIHEILTDVSDSFSQMIDMALANEIQMSGQKSAPKSVVWKHFTEQPPGTALCRECNSTVKLVSETSKTKNISNTSSHLKVHHANLYQATQAKQKMTSSTSKTAVQPTLVQVYDHQLKWKDTEKRSKNLDKVLIRQVEESDDVFLMENAISNLLSLTQDGPQLCSIIAKEGAVVALLKICRQDCFSSLYAPALRTVASICCVEEGINQLEKVDGVLCLADILTDEGCTEAARAEAAAVVAQITSPHHSSTHHLSSFIESMQDIVSALIKLCETASCGEVFLLSSAALANITFFDSLACEILLQLNAVHTLLQACRDRQRVDTPYSKDQVVTILANLSVLEQTASEVLQEDGLERLLVLLGEKPSSSSPSEGAACERVQQKAAVTLARLSRDPEVAQAAIKLRAVPRLIELCRSPAERNSSDSVLVACLAALRRLAAGCSDSIDPTDHQQLIKPRLVDSFLLCSNMEESFV